MRNTGSTRTATRWWSSNTAAALALLALAACATAVTTDYLPTAGQMRVDRTQLRHRAQAMLQAECPRLVTSKHRSVVGRAHFLLEVENTGNVVRARMDHGSGDRRLNTIFGGLVAQLRLDPAAGSVGSRLEGVTMGFGCSPRAAVAAVTFDR